MSNVNLGTKRTCLQCQTKFYDLKKLPIICPKCEAEFDPTDFVKKKRGRPSLAEINARKAAEAELKALEDKDDDLDLEVDDDKTLDDDADFGDDEDIVAPKKSNDDE